MKKVLLLGCVYSMSICSRSQGLAIAEFLMQDLPIDVTVRNFNLFANEDCFRILCNGIASS